MPANHEPTASPAVTESEVETWVFGACVRCGRSDGEVILTIPHPDAPLGLSFIRKCAGCGLRRLDPRPGPDVIGRYYAAASDYNAFEGRRRSPRAQRLWDFLRDGYSRPSVRSFVNRLFGPLAGWAASWLFDINVRIDGRAGLRVIEVGSGYGDILMYLKSRGCDVLGTDLNPGAAEVAARSGIQVRVGHLQELHLPEASFDVGILSHSLEHVPDPAAELRELARLIAPGGFLHIAVPNGAAARLETDGVEWIHLSHPFHLWFFDPDSLVEMVLRAGFEPIGRPRTTTRHHAWGLWRAEAMREGLMPATRRLFRYLNEAIGRRDAGDVLRLVCRRKADQPK